jgi:hypothetical protein
MKRKLNSTAIVVALPSDAYRRLSYEHGVAELG